MNFQKLSNNWILILSVLLSTPVFAQERDLSDMSAKEKAELARQEQLDAARDGAFLNLMDEGHAFFVEKQYLKAIRKYEQAGERRPLNVYPPVKIRDIELSMKDTLEILREQEKQEQPAPKEERQAKQQELPDRDKEMEEFRESEKNRQKKAEDWEASQRRQLARERALREEKDQESKELAEQSGSDVGEISLEEFQKDLGQQYSEGITQRTYTEGQRKITERIVVKGEKGNEYRMVEHPWGGKFFFKNGTPISEETWNQETAQ